MKVHKGGVVVLKKEIEGVTLEVIKGDISDQKDIEAVVNAANARLMPGGGVAGAIHHAAGPKLAEECRPLAPIEVGEAVITGAHKLPNDYIIHTLGPVYGKDTPEDELLATCYRETLEVAEDNQINSIAFPAISTGAFGYPIQEAAEIAFDTVLDKIPELNEVNQIRFVLYSESDQECHEQILGKLLKNREQ